MDSTFAAQLLNHICRGRIERVSCTQASGEFQLLAGNVDRSHLRAKGPSELHCKVSQATYAENRQALAARHTAFQCAIDCQSGTKKRGSFERRQPTWNFQRVRCPLVPTFG